MERAQNHAESRSVARASRQDAVFPMRGPTSSLIDDFSLPALTQHSLVLAQLNWRMPAGCQVTSPQSAWLVGHLRRTTWEPFCSFSSVLPARRDLLLPGAAQRLVPCSWRMEEEP